ncbi:COP9 signalosome [Geopyxis carbonaria]|nr:COP9 signalosome [Geopyxis carbonaria]
MSLFNPQITEDFLCLVCSSELEPTILIEAFAGLEATAQTDPTVTELLPAFYSSYLLLLFLDEDLAEARFLVQRIPTHVLIDHILTNGIDLLRALCSRSYPSVYQFLLNSVWPSTIIPLRNRFLKQFQKRTSSLLTTAYTSISPQLAAEYMGLPTSSDDMGVDALVGEQWFMNDHPGVLQSVLTKEEAAKHPHDNHDIRKLTRLVTHLTED